MKKLLALALVFILALSLLTACNGNSTTPSGDNNTPSGNAGDNSTPSGNGTTDPDDNNSVAFCKVGDIIKFGEYDWRVLDVQDGKALIITDKNIFIDTFHDEDAETLTWADSDMRAWFNDGLYNSFNETDRARIVQVTNKNPDNPWDFTAIGGLNKTPGGPDTQDYIFLLSLDEVVKYFGDSGQLANQKHPDNDERGFGDQYSVNRIAADSLNDISEVDGVLQGFWWWLRSPGGMNGFFASIDWYGNVEVVGTHYGQNTGGIRPALWLNP